MYNMPGLKHVNCIYELFKNFKLILKEYESWFARSREAVEGVSVTTTVDTHWHHQEIVFRIRSQSRFWAVKILHISPEQNALADTLVRIGLRSNFNCC
ncbi:hypothetical protein RJT34_16294 [Clitoria ternatea]|uniref:Uncharacterized protein n=1 Tax=Clitoria ternatea TaxID=43366 RepID=A0AAN9J833_CLITE